MILLFFIDLFFFSFFLFFFLGDFQEMGGGEAGVGIRLQEAFSRRFANARYCEATLLMRCQISWSRRDPVRDRVSGCRLAVAGWINGICTRIYVYGICMDTLEAQEAPMKTCR